MLSTIPVKLSTIPVKLSTIPVKLSTISRQVYLADFGLARKYVMEGVHKTYKEEPAKAHDGTKEFTSIDAHKGFYFYYGSF